MYVPNFSPLFCAYCTFLPSRYPILPLPFQYSTVLPPVEQRFSSAGNRGHRPVGCNLPPSRYNNKKEKAVTDMANRLKLKDRLLPPYSRSEEIMNMVTHIVGGGIGIAALVLCIFKTVRSGNIYGLVGSVIYGITMICLYSISSIYHGLRPSTGKKVMQVLDHCTIYFLICGTYTPILLSSFVPVYPFLGWGLLAAEWVLAILAATLTAIDLKKYNIFSMICYIAMGWGIVFFLPQAMQVLTWPGFLVLLSGGIAYTVGAVLYGIGAKKQWFHSVFHIFVVLGSLLQFLAILLYSL